MKTDRGISDREVKRTPANRCAGVLNFRSFSSSSNYVTRAPLQPRLRDVPREGYEHVQYARDERPSRILKRQSSEAAPDKKLSVLNAIRQSARGAMPSVIFHLRRPEAGQPMPFDLALPDQEFVDRQTIALAGIVEAQKSAADCRDNFGLSAGDPAFGIRRGKIRDGQRTAVGSNDITEEGTVEIGHGAHTHNLDPGRTLVAGV